MFLGDAPDLPDGGGHLRDRRGVEGLEGEPPDVSLPPPSQRPHRYEHIFNYLKIYV